MKEAIAIFLVYIGWLHISVFGQKLSPNITSLHIQSDIRYRFATTLITSIVVNPANVSREVLFDVILPNEAFITNFTLEIEDQIYIGEVKEKERAKKQYVKAKKRGQSAGHVSAKPRETNKFNVEVNVAALSHVTFNLTYQELLRRNVGKYEHVIYVDPGQIVEDFRIEVAIQESRDITKLRVPPLRSDLIRKVRAEETNELAVIQRPTRKSAFITYSPSKDDQLVINNQTGLSGQFVVEYDVDRWKGAGEVLVVNGYLVHFFATKGLTAMSKDVLFILDKSGSMQGRKIEQLKEAMLNIVDDLQPNDRFSIMVFDRLRDYFRETLSPVSNDTVSAAKTYIKNIKASGGTNINVAMIEGIRLMNSKVDAERAPILIFLTDGEATVGITDRTKILSNIATDNELSIPIFTLGFGSGADFNFVRKVAAQNNGFGRRIYEDSDAALQIEGLYDELSTVLLKNITFNYLNGTVKDNTMTKLHFNTYFGGTELLVAAQTTRKNCNYAWYRYRYRSCWSSASVRGLGYGGYTTYRNPLRIRPRSSSTLNLIKDENIQKISEKLWAYLSIKQMLKKTEASTNETEQELLKNKTINLSVKYNFVTPVTSMVVTLPAVTESLDDKQKLFESGQKGIAKKLVGKARSQIGKPQSQKGTTQSRVMPALPRLTRTTALLRYTTTTGAATRFATLPPQSTRHTTFTVYPPLPFGILVKGMSEPLCVDFGLSAGKTYKLFEHTESGTSVFVDTMTNPNPLSVYSGALVSEVRINSTNKLLKFSTSQYSIDSHFYQWNVTSFSYSDWLGNVSYALDIAPLKGNGGMRILTNVQNITGKISGLFDYFAGVKGTVFSSTGYRIEFKDGVNKHNISASSVTNSGPLFETCWLIEDISILGVKTDVFQV